MPAFGANDFTERLRLRAGRLARRWPAWSTALLVAIGLAAAGGVVWPVALIGLLGATAVVAAWPENGSAARERAEIAPGSEGIRLEAWRAFAEALPDPALILDRRGLILHRNEAAGRDLDVRADEPMTASLRHPALVQAVETVRRTGRPHTVEMHQTVPNETWHRVAVAPLGRPEEGLLLVTLESLTEARRIEAMRRDFVANASHELRTPLASLSGAVDTLLGPAANDPAARARFLAMMRGQADRMSKLIEDLLSLSRIELRQHVRPTGQVELGPLLTEVAAGLGPLAEASGVAVSLSLAEAPAVVTGDREELYEVFENLLDNAVKYGGEGKRVEIALVAADRPGFAHKVSVIDHGAGIAPEHVPRLTERFYRVDAESSRRMKGTGLGLAIVKHIVARHRGQLAITSLPGEGTRVDVYLPD